MIQMINGVSRIDGVDRKASDGSFEASPDVEKRLVSLGAAEYVVTAAPPKMTAADNGIPEQVQSLARDVEEINGTNIETAETENGTGNETAEDEDDSETEVKLGTYSIDTPVSELRTIAKEVGISFKVCTTKEEMVAMLDDYFNSPENKPPNLTAMGPV